MARYLVAIHHPDNYQASSEDAAMVKDIGVLNEEMIAKGARVFAGGLLAASNANRTNPDQWPAWRAGPLEEGPGCQGRKAPVK